MFKWVANMHGDETVGRVATLAMAEYLLKNYPENPEVKTMMETTEFHLMPSMNPDGFEVSMDESRVSRSQPFLVNYFFLPSIGLVSALRSFNFQLASVFKFRLSSEVHG
jgi:murein tripeptide amidase MpaA